MEKSTEEATEHSHRAELDSDRAEQGSDRAELDRGRAKKSGKGARWKGTDGGDKAQPQSRAGQ